MRLTQILRLCISLMIISAVAITAGCTKQQDTNTSNSPQSNKSATQTSGRAKSGATGTITANPNPIQICDGTGLGVANISWSFSGAKLVEVRVGSPDGGLVASAGAPGTKSTDKWVGAGSVFYLQDVSDGLPLTADNTIATLTVNVTTQGCP
jgi:hypothetical protein